MKIVNKGQTLHVYTPIEMFIVRGGSPESTYEGPNAKTIRHLIQIHGPDTFSTAIFAVDEFFHILYSEYKYYKEYSLVYYRSQFLVNIEDPLRLGDTIKCITDILTSLQWPVMFYQTTGTFYFLPVRGITPQEVDFDNEQELLQQVAISVAAINEGLHKNIVFTQQDLLLPNDITSTWFVKFFGKIVEIYGNDWDVQKLHRVNGLSFCRKNK